MSGPIKSSRAVHNVLNIGVILAKAGTHFDFAVLAAA